MSERLGLLDALLLGILQGLTEWLPISSSGHLVILRHIRDIHEPVLLDLVLHVGTLAVVVFFYRTTLLHILRALGSLPRRHRAGTPLAELARDEHVRLAFFLVIGTLPIVLAALLFEDWFLAQFESLASVGVALLVTGVLLFATRWAPSVQDAMRPLTLGGALVVGVAQAAAILPGISRSGMTLVAALFLGLERENAVRYSFLLSIPAILGATLFQARDAALHRALDDVAAYAVGTVAAIVVGYVALRFIVLLVKRGGLHHFSYYCWIVGAALLAWTMT